MKTSERVLAKSSIHSRNRRNVQPPLPRGPGSKVASLSPGIRLHLRPHQTRKSTFYDIDFACTSTNRLPDDIFYNEELQLFARSLLAQNNRLKSISKDVALLKAIEIVDLNNNLLKKFPLKLLRMKRIKELCLSRNDLSTLPPTIHRMISLERLFVSDNHLKTLPLVVGRMKTLKIVDASRNSISKLKKSIYKCSMALDISHNELTKLPRAVEPTSIRGINASHNFLKHLPLGIENLTKLTELDVSRNEIETLRREIGYLPYLRRLDVSGNRLTSVPGELCDFAQTLVELNLEGNLLMEFPKSMTTMKNLKVLNLARNKLENLDGFIDDVCLVEDLNLSDNNLVNVGWLSNLIGCERLDLSNNKIKELPTGLSNIAKLKHLDVSGNKLTCLPDCTADLLQLKHLMLARNSITCPPDRLGLNQLLETIDLSSNRIESLSDQLMRNLKSTVKLNLSNNEFKALPNTVSRLTNLKDFSSAGNKLNDVVIPDSVEELDLSMNPLFDPYTTDETTIYGRLARDEHRTLLTKLILSKVSLHEVPECILEMSKLLWLDLSSNAISKLPEKFKSLKNLIHLNLSSNQLTGLTNVCTSDHLEILKLSNNKMTKFCGEILSFGELKYLDISHNFIDALPPDFSNLYQLLHLDLSDNRIRNFPNARLHVLASLKYLNLTGNFLTRLPPSFSRLYRLETALIGGNLLTEIPRDAGPGMKNLRLFDLSQNRLSLVPICLNSCPKLRELRLTGNKCIDDLEIISLFDCRVNVVL